MSAVKIIFKRSSLLGKRPTDANLEAGEIGLNTNSTDPGLFFETNNGSVVKVGPTAYLPESPTQTPARGELWVDSDTKNLSIGTQLSQWQKVSAPFLGGTSGFTVFVAPEFENATDSLANDGQSVPFVTLNRAIIEVTKYIVRDTLNGVSLGNNRYLIVLAPGQHCVTNRPGTSTSNFSVDFSNPYAEVTQAQLAEFNPDIVGGLVLPRGVSVIGMDLKKCEVRPTYVPFYTHPAFPADYSQQPGGPIYASQPRSSIFRWSGNTYVSNWTALDKVESRLVVRTETESGTGNAVFVSSRPHGLDFNDFVKVSYSDSTDQIGASFKAGPYYVYPVTAYKFMLSPTPWGTGTNSPVLASSLPSSFFGVDAAADPKFVVENIYPYFIPPNGIDYELQNYSHHRLSVLKNASLSQLNDFYVKVQKAFPGFFGGRVNTNLVSAPEYDIVAPTTGEYPSNLSSNSTDNTSPYQNMVNHRSDYGMANGDYDGDIVSGFKSVIINSSTAVILQKDPVAYEIYSTSAQDWIQLTQYTRQSLGGNLPITSVPIAPQLTDLNDAAIPNVRYYYTTLTVLDPETGAQKSIGVPDTDNDFRHFGFRLSGPNSYMQAQSTYTIGAAIACWAKYGALISLTNATTNFGSVAFQAEGFAGLGTLGGANQINKGFLQAGVVRPLQLSEEAVVSDEQKRILYLGSKVVFIGPDPNDPSVQQIYLQRPFDPATILPFSLKPGSAVFVGDGICEYRAFFVTDGSPTCILSGPIPDSPCTTEGAILRVRMYDTTIPSTSPDHPVDGLNLPYIRRFIDPRTPSEKCYGFYVQSTNPTSQAPQLGSVLRLNQTGQSLSDTIKRNFQFDPGQYGGVSQVFTVDSVETEQYSASTNFNYKVADSSQSTNYVVYASLTDASTPWVQSVPTDPSDLDSPLTPFNTPQGSYLTYENKNYYAAENNLWSALYYKTTFNPLNGPTKVSPNKFDSSFVITSVLENTEVVTNSWQGYVPDPYYDYYVNGVPSPANANLSYMRGAVVPYTEIAPQYQVDDDDGSSSLGIIFKRLPLDVNATITVAPSTVVQTAEAMTSPFASNPTFGRPEIIQLDLLAVRNVTLPQEDVSVLQLTSAGMSAVEYVRVVSVNSNSIQAIRNCYPQYSEGELPAVWPAGTTVKTCVSTGYPEPSVYDPSWAVTKATMFRFFQLMGYSSALISQYLTPRINGERLLLNADLPISPINGYAAITSAWPVEFNNPSTVVANTHTWQYAGYFDYSRGLPKYQVNQIPRKLSFDFLSMTTWGGRLTIMGANEEGQLVFLGPIKEALTSQFFVTETPLSYAADRQIYRSSDPVILPNPVLVFSTDDISGQFDGSRSTFDLTRGGYPIPGSQLSTFGVFVTLGGVVQKPNTAYRVQTDSSGASLPTLIFSEPPVRGTSCDVRVVTSDDDSESLEVINLTFSPSFDGSLSVFELSPSLPSVSNLNSFIFLSGVEQNPQGINQSSAAYTVVSTSTSSVLTFIGGAPQEGTTLDARAILSGNKYRGANVSSVFTVSTDDFSPLFDNVRTTFPLLIGGVPADSTKVNAQNIFVSLGGVMQIPIAQAGNALAGNAYTVALNPTTRLLEITFATAPPAGTTCNIRIVTSDQVLTCPLPASIANPVLLDGPGIIVNESNQIVSIDPGLLN